MRMSQASSTQVRVEIDRIYLRLNDIDKNNARIKKQIQRFETLDKGERKETRDLL